MAMQTTRCRYGRLAASTKPTLLKRLAIFLAFNAAVLTGPAQQTKHNPTALASASSASEYVGSETCARCHLAIYQQYSKTNMGRSMSPATVDLPGHAATSGSYTSEKFQRTFQVYTESNKLYQNEAGLATGGTESFRETNQLRWIIGAGMNGFGALIQKDNYLFQAPLSFYSKSGTWAPSPGYEFADLGFNRPILPGCIACHSGRPNPVAGSNGKFESEPFSELAIGCERCHGPGAAHILSVHESKGAHVDASIVNPVRLTPYMADNICMACHQAGDVRALKAGKSYSDIRPGHPLDETVAIFMIPPARDNPPTDDHVDHYYSMTLSKCYRASQGRMSCITCHDPHTEPSSVEAPAYFRAKCLTCHTNQSCKLSLEARLQRTPANNCIGCHMPKREIQTISHSSTTNHRIIASANEPFPEIAFNQTTAALGDLIHLDPLPDKKPEPPPLLTLLSAYGELSESRTEYVSSYLKVLAQLEKAHPEDPTVQAALGRRDLKSGDLASAVKHLRSALESSPASATTYVDLAEALAKQHQMDEVIPLLKRAVELDPYNPASQKLLVVNLAATMQYEKAHTALQRYLEAFPQDDFMRQMLARAEGKAASR